MAETYKRIAQLQVAAAAAVIYTVPAGTQTVVKHIRAVNTTTGTPATIGLFHGGTDAAHRVLPDVPLNPGEWCEEDGLFTLAAGDTLAAVSSVANAITLTIYGIELTP